MPKVQRFNWKLFLVVLIGLAVLMGTGYGLHKWNRSGRAEKGLVAGQKALTLGQWRQAAHHLGSYIANTPNSPKKIAVMMQYAQAQLNRRPLTKRKIALAIESYRAIQRIEMEFALPPAQQSQATEKLVELYLLRNIPEEAELIASRAMNASPSPALRSLYAQSLVNQRKFQEGAKIYQALIQDHPDYIPAYESMGILTELRRGDFAVPPQHWFEQAVKNNQTNPLAYIGRAEYLYRRHEMDRAKADLGRAMALVSPDDKTIHLRLIKALLQIHDLEHVEKYLAAAEKIKPDDQELWYLWALFALQSNDKEKQVEVAQQGLLALKNQPWDFLPSAIDLFFTAGQDDRAAQCVEQLRTQKVSLPIVAYFEGRFAEKRGDSFKALQFWNQALQQGLESSPLRLAMARVALQLGNRYEASQYLRKILETRPNHFQARLELAKLLSKSGHWREVEQQSQIARQLAPENLSATLLYLQARSHRLGQESVPLDSFLWQKMAQEYLTLQAAFPDSLERAISQVQFEVIRHRYDQARMLVEQLGQKFPDKPEVALARIRLDLAQNNAQVAMEHLVQAIAHYDQVVVFDQLLAQLYLRNNENKKSQAVLSKAIARVKNPLFRRQCQLQLVQCRQKAGQSQEAYQLLKKLTQDFPQDISIKSLYLRTPQIMSDANQAQSVIDQIRTLEGLGGHRWYYEQAYFWFYQKDFFKYESQIIEHLKNVLSANPQDSAAHLLLARTDERSGKVTLALMEYRNALNRAPNDANIMAAYASLLYRTGDYERADAILDKATKLNIEHPLLDRFELYRRLRLNQVESAVRLLRKSIDESPDKIGLQLLLVQIKIEQKHYEKAAQLLSEIRKKDPDSLEAIEWCIEVSLLQNDTQRALHYCDQLIKERKNPAAYTLRAKTYARLNRLDDAIKDIEKTTALEPDNVDLWIEKSRFYLDLGQHEKALTTIRKAMDVGKDSLLAKKYALKLLLSSKNPQDRQQGQTILEQALQIDPQDIELRLAKARLLLIKNWATAQNEAESILKSITKQQPLATEAWALLGGLYLRQNNPGQAINVIMNGLANLPNNKKLLYLKSQAESIHSPQIAISTLKGIHELYPNDFDVVLNLANLYADDEQSDKAIDLLKQEMAHLESPLLQKKARLTLIKMEHFRGNSVLAYSQLEEFRKSYPDDHDLFLTYVDCFIKDQRWFELSEMACSRIEGPEDSLTLPLIAANRLAKQSDAKARENAERVFRKVIQHDPKDTKALNDFARFLYQAERFSESAKIFESLLSIDPQAITAVNNLAWILSTELDRNTEALELAQQGLDTHPDYADLLDTRGVIYYHLGDYQKSVQDFERCLSLYPSSHPSRAGVHLRLAKALAALNRIDQARERLEKALRIDQTQNTLTQSELQQANRLLTQLR